MKLPKVIYIMGPPGAGKGTQAKMLAEKIGYVQFSTGDAFREVSRQDTDLGKRVKETIDNGFLAPPEMAAEIVIAAVQKNLEAGEGLIFDGTPRTVEEAKIVDEHFASKGLGDPLAIYLKVNKEVMMKRNSERQYCLGVKGGFPIITDQDKQECEKIGGSIGTRPDDEPEIFSTRWDEFMTRTYPVIKKYEELDKINELDGLGTIDEVFDSIMTIVNKYEQGSIENS